MSYEIVFFGENMAWVGERIFNADSNKKTVSFFLKRSFLFSIGISLFPS